jgi:hypothetical protein
LEAVFSVIRATAVAMQWRGKHVSSNKSTVNNRGTVGNGVFYAVLAKGISMGEV